MASQRDRIIKLIELAKLQGIEINISKNKAQGNRGFFRAKGCLFRIDIAKSLSEEEQLRVLLHEFAHYIHYTNDNKLQDLKFIINDLNEDILEEMIALTVDSVSQEQAKKLFEAKLNLKEEIKSLTNNIKNEIKDFKSSEINITIEKAIKKKGLAPLLKYDNVKILNGFSTKLYSINEVDNYLNNEFVLQNYLKLKSKQRALKRINSRINKLNKYYNHPSELFARSIEYYFLNKPNMEKKAPSLKELYDNILEENKVYLLTECARIFQ